MARFRDIAWQTGAWATRTLTVEVTSATSASRLPCMDTVRGGIEVTIGGVGTSLTAS